MENVKFWRKELSNISEFCRIGEGSVIHAGVHIHDDVVIGKNCQIEAQVFIPTGVTIQDNVFVGPQVCFTNDPKLNQSREEWKPTPTLVCEGAKIGAGARILAGVTIGKGAIVGMGAVVYKDVADNTVVKGNPAEEVRKVYKPEEGEQDFSHLDNDHFLDTHVPEQEHVN